MREDTYLQDHGHLVPLSDADLEGRFWEFACKIVEPLVELGRTHTSPSIERSVLMRMGLDSLTCAAVVAGLERRGLLGHGAGHVVLHCARQWDVDVRAAATKLAGGEGWQDIERKWGGRHGA